MRRLAQLDEAAYDPVVSLSMPSQHHSGTGIRYKEYCMHVSSVRYPRSEDDAHQHVVVNQFRKTRTDLCVKPNPLRVIRFKIESRNV